MRYSANVLLALLCAAACTGSSLAADLPDQPPTDGTDSPAVTQPAPEGSVQVNLSTDTDTEEPVSPEVPTETEIDEPVPPDIPTENVPEQPDISIDPDMDDRFLIPSEPEEPDTPTAPHSIVLTRFDAQTAFDLTAVPIGDDAALHTFFDNLRTGLCGYDADGTSYDFVTGAWDFSAIDLSTSGLYYASAPLLLVDENNVPCFTLAEGVTAPEMLCRVSVQEIGKPDISEFLAARGRMIFPWVLTDEQQAQLDRFSVWMKPENGIWTPVSADACSLKESELSLRPQILELRSGDTYSLQVDYPGGQTGILTFVYDDTPLKTGYAEGSHDGGGENTTLPDVIQPAPSHSGGSHHTSQPTPEPPQPEEPSGQPTPEPPSADPAPLPDEPSAVVPTVPNVSTTVPEITIPAQPVLRAQAGDAQSETAQTSTQPAADRVETVSAASSASVIERDTADGTTLSGTRLLALIELNEPLVLTKDGITFSVPTEALRALQLTQNDTLSVTLTRASDGTAQAELLLNGVPLDTISGMTLTDDLAPAEAPAQPAGRSASVSSAPDLPRRALASPLPFAVAGAAALAGAACLLRRRKRS